MSHAAAEIEIREPEVLRPGGFCHLCGEAFGGYPTPLIGHNGFSTIALLCDSCAEGMGVAPEWDDEDGDEEYDEEPWDGFLTDAEADADVLAGAGWGCDEDYGCFGCDE